MVLNVHRNRKAYDGRVFLNKLERIQFRNKRTNRNKNGVSKTPDFRTLSNNYYYNMFMHNVILATGNVCMVRRNLRMVMGRIDGCVCTQFTV